MDISVITPIYKGNKYISNLLRIIGNNAKNAQGISIELVLVNDSPEIPLEVDKSQIDNFSLVIYENPQNMGIQAARVNGIKASSGTYIMMLDQDDELDDDALVKQFTKVNGSDGVLSNGLNEGENGEKVPLFKGERQINKANNIKYYYYFGNLIASPGLCLIKRTAIPTAWMNNLMKINGADDWLLWALYLQEGKKFIINNELLYIHKNVGSNCSGNGEQMLKSSEEALEIMTKTGNANRKLLKVYKRRLKMRRAYENKGKKKKLIEYLKNIDIAWYLVKHKYL